MAAWTPQHDGSRESLNHPQPPARAAALCQAPLWGLQTNLPRPSRQTGLVCTAHRACSEVSCPQVSQERGVRRGGRRKAAPVHPSETPTEKTRGWKRNWWNPWKWFIVPARSEVTHRAGLFLSRRRSTICLVQERKLLAICSQLSCWFSKRPLCCVNKRREPR